MNSYVLPRVGGLKLQKLDESEILQLYVELRNGGRVKRDNNRPMYEFWAAGVAAGEPPTPRAVSEARGTTIHAARGLVKASFVPPPPIRALRDLTRARTVITSERTREVQRLEKLLEDAGIKLSSVGRWNLFPRPGTL